ncbi:hypothetical protein J6S37_00840 [Candidatus Saccharibacteria bacterium]|nr:hypothetical protein [Candidatus Saccharibacteria bacterium]
MKIAIIGAGAFGTALGGVLANNGCDIDYYDSRTKEERLYDVVGGSDYILLAVPSKAVPYVLPHLPKNIPMIVATKGILSAKTFDGFKDYMVLSGPGFADDIKAQKDTFFTFTDKRLVELFRANYVFSDYTDDENGVLLCCSLKNVYAIQAVILGLARGSADWNEYIRDVSNEMRAVLKSNGADGETVGLYCGIGDLKLTCGYPSRNYEFGDKYRADSTYQPEKTVEGLSAIRKILKHEIEVPCEAVILNTILKTFSSWFK